MFHQLGFMLSLLCCSLCFCGCVESQSAGQTAPFEEQELDACLAIVVDMSGSFSERWEDRAYDMFLELSESYFAGSMGTNTKLVIGQLSGNEQVLLFEGRPSDLRCEFKSPEELHAFLREHCDPSGSRVYDATQRTIDYVGSISGVTENTRLMTVILSDMRDTGGFTINGEPPADLLESLTRYREQGGGLALYYVAEDEAGRWQGILEEAGFEPGHYIIENDLVANPQLPKFD